MNYIFIRKCVLNFIDSHNDKIINIYVFLVTERGDYLQYGNMSIHLPHKYLASVAT